MLITKFDITVKNILLQNDEDLTVKICQIHKDKLKETI